MQHLERFITYNSCMLSHSLAEPRSCRTSLSIDCTSTGILEYFLSSVPPQSVTGPPGTHSLPHPRGWVSLMLAPSSSEVGTLLQSHGLCSPRVVHALLNICSHHSSLCLGVGWVEGTGLSETKRPPLSTSSRAPKRPRLPRSKQKWIEHPLDS